MIKMINRLNGADMWVADDRVDEYKAAGHKLAAKTSKEVAPVAIEEEPIEKHQSPKKTTKGKTK